MVSIYVVLVIVFESILLHGSSESLKAGFKAGSEKKELSVSALFSSLPLIIFSYMYQVNVPGIYQDLEKKKLITAKKVLGSGTLLAAVLYISAGIFGYITFADGSSQADLEKWFGDNILAAPYHGKSKDSGTPIAIYIALFGMMFVVMMATPFCVLPSKDSIEEVMKRKFTKTENLIWT